MTEEEEEEKNQKILDIEIQSWKGFEYALRQENRLLFNKMLKECQGNEEEYSKAAAARGEGYSAESLFMALIFQQQKIISSLIDKLSESRKSTSACC
jgi:hypothetical protein